MEDKQLIEKVLTTVGLSSLKDGEEEEALAMIEEIAAQEFYKIILEQLSPEQKEKLLELEKDSMVINEQSAVQEFLTRELGDLEELKAQAAKRVMAFFRSQNFE